MVVDPLTKGMPPIKFKDHIYIYIYIYIVYEILMHSIIFSFLCALLIHLRKYIS